MPAYPRLWRDPRLPARVWDKIEIDRSGPRTRGAYCWIWTAGKSGGYGTVGWAGKTRKAHRVLYFVLVGPTELELDHLCRRPACVNPRHLDPVTHRVNQSRGAGNRNAAIRARMETGLCANGHNAWARNQKYPDTWYCKECRLARARGKRGVPNKEKTHCKNGHEFTPENTYIPPGRFHRKCRACMLARRTS